ncbi:MAG TPA: ParA family protein [Hyphomicrobiaceae bacterium]|nr:ParA family protein [Hyphomicrobiaceae bacterium]
MATKQPPRLRVVTFANAKGGVGKSTLCSALAVRAAEDSKKVALLDLDPQESLASWWTRRGRTKNPKLHEIDATTEAIELLIAEGWEWVFVDTGPAKLELIEPGIFVADLVLIPTRPSAFDIEQAAICVELCETHGKPHAFVFNQATPGTKLTRTSMEYLQSQGSRVLKSPVITFLPSYMAALTVGKSGPELGGRDGLAARKEIDALWTAVKKLLSEQDAS